jgi:hypothetical protein
LRRGGSRRGLWRGSGSRFGVRVVLVVGVSVPVIGRRRRLLRLGSRLGRRSRSRLLGSRSWGGLLSRKRRWLRRGFGRKRIDDNNRS